MKFKLSEQVMNGIEDRFIIEAMGAMEDSENPRISERKHFPWIRQAGIAAASLGILLATSFSGLAIAAAAGSMTAYDILHTLYPYIAVRLTPVQISCEDQGIRMEVEGVDIRENQADIYISVEDLIGDRIDETTDLFDSYHMTASKGRGDGGLSGGCSKVSYDEKNKTVTFLISILLPEGQKIEGEKMTFRVSELLTGKSEWEKELKEVHLKESLEECKVQSQAEIHLRGMSAKEGVAFLEKGQIEVLESNDAVSFSPTESVAVTAYGFVKDQLHVQVHYADILEYDNHGRIYLKNETGEIQNSIASVSFWDEAGTGSYEEYLFDVSPEEAGEYTVWGAFVTCGTNIQGDWQVTFPLENSR